MLLTARRKHLAVHRVWDVSQPLSLVTFTMASAARTQPSLVSLLKTALLSRLFGSKNRRMSRVGNEVVVVKSVGDCDLESQREAYNHGTLKEKLAYMKNKIQNDEEIDGDLPDEKGKRPFDIKAKYKKIMNVMHKAKEEKELRDEIVAYEYSTDMSFLRRSTPDQVWTGVKRRAAWIQVPFKMFGVAAAQITLCLVCLLTKNSAVNPSTSLMAGIYIATVCASNPFAKCGDVSTYIQRWFGLLPPRKKDAKPRKPNYIGLIIFLILASPVLIVVLAVTFLLDVCIGEIVDLSYGELLNAMVNIIVIFTGFSVGLRSETAVGAVQTFAGFQFVSVMDELLMDTIELDLDRKVQHIYGKEKDRKVLTVRLTLYIMTPVLLAFFMWITFTNTCLAFCNVV